MNRDITQAQEYAAHRKQKGDGVAELMRGLEAQFGDNFAQIQRGNVVTIMWVYDDSRPNVSIIEVKT